MNQLYTLSSNIQTSSGLKKPNKSYENQKIIFIFEKWGKHAQDDNLS